MTTNIAKAIVDRVNTETNLGLEFQGLTEMQSITCLTPRGQRAVIVCYGSNIDPIIRSVVAEKRRGHRFTWLLNGQANKNAKELAYWDESHRFVPTAQQAAEALAENIQHLSPLIEFVKKGGQRLPSHLDRQAVTEALKELQKAR